jgi:hypothetical protein
MQDAQIDTASAGDVRIGADHAPDAAFFAGTMAEVAIFDAPVGRTAIYQTYLFQSTGGHGSGIGR